MKIDENFNIKVGRTWHSQVSLVVDLFLALLLLAFIVFAVVTVTWSPPRVQAQAIGYVASGQQAVTATAAKVTGITYGTVCIKALAGNTIDVYIGPPGVTISTGMEMAADDAYCMPTNASPFYVVASTTGASVSWIVSR